MCEKWEEYWILKNKSKKKKEYLLYFIPRNQIDQFVKQKKELEDQNTENSKKILDLEKKSIILKK